MLLNLSIIMAKQARRTDPLVAEEAELRSTDDVLKGLTDFIQSAQWLTPTEARGIVNSQTSR